MQIYSFMLRSLVEKVSVVDLSDRELEMLLPFQKWYFYVKRQLFDGVRTRGIKFLLSSNYCKFNLFVCLNF